MRADSPGLKDGGRCQAQEMKAIGEDVGRGSSLGLCAGWCDADAPGTLSSCPELLSLCLIPHQNSESPFPWSRVTIEITYDLPCTRHICTALSAMSSIDPFKVDSDPKDT